jgi:hypothetical protein
MTQEDSGMDGFEHPKEAIKSLRDVAIDGI